MCRPIQFFLVLLLCGSSKAMGQHVAGLKAGMNLSSQRYLIDGIRASDDSGNKVAFHIGILYEKSFNPRHGLQPELIYSLEGARATETDGNMNLSYLKLPVLWFFQPSDLIRFLIGPEFAYLLNARANSHGWGTDREDAYENFVVNVAGGVEYLSATGLRLGVRYSRGLSNFLNREFYTLDLRSKTDTFQLYAAFVFKIY